MIKDWSLQVGYMSSAKNRYFAGVCIHRHKIIQNYPPYIITIVHELKQLDYAESFFIVFYFFYWLLQNVCEGLVEL
jgi:hypothetical protein